MNQELDLNKEPRDYTKWIWIGIIILALVFLGAIKLLGAPKPPGSAVRISHILLLVDPGDNAARLRVLELAQELRERILNGESFEELAKEYSEDPSSGKRGGNVGYTSRGDLVDSVEKYAWSAPIGQISEVVQSGLGFHIIKVTDRYISEHEVSEQELEIKAREQLRLERLKQLGESPEDTPSDVTE